MEINPESLINLYKNGIFPMGDHKDSNQIFWCNPILIMKGLSCEA